MNWQQWTFSILDTCFFREALPFNAGEGGYTATKGIFPPAMTTLQGAVRTALALERGWRPGEVALWPKELGGPDDLGELELRGPYLLFEDQPYFPMPLILLEKSGHFTRLTPGEPVTCDLGCVRLPVPERRLEGAKLPEGYYLSRDGLCAVLDGVIPSTEDIKKAEELWAEEVRVGIERQDSTRTALEGHLYNCVHVRPAANVKLVVFVSGIPSDWQVAGRRVVPLGGEGRLAAIEITPAEPAGILPSVPLICGEDGKLRFTVTLVTPGWYGKPQDVQRVIREGPPGIPGRCVSACIGKVQQVGGWDLANQQPRPLMPVLPPGSTWFYEAGATDAGQVARLHGQCLGFRAAYGFGQIAIGRWEEKKNE
ncbi:CRISPR-associated Cmr3 family protein [Thermodesulfitimonas autotrophica]|uniref:CRISPR-associated Cmr3 family protein n=1 Tax=Thermodesulfitimonas autotrophica TaxID=1894989 RepID=A0A3N5BT91_9THEO|nr:type III-B CRISPR module-associated Cmr3 family protein [Thermodesulfitimonas autotrophica]RPF47001.1 CRISPR-associated Cmr3 family protein [Thermodesulfitimonas autotrophica]